MRRLMVILCNLRGHRYQFAGDTGTCATCAKVIDVLRGWPIVLRDPPPPPRQITEGELMHRRSTVMNAIVVQRLAEKCGAKVPTE